MSWFDWFFRAEQPDPGSITVRSVTFDTRGCRVQSRTPERIEWRDLDGDEIVACVESVAADPRVTSDVGALRAHYRDEARAHGAGLVSVDVLQAAGVPVTRVITKFEDMPAYRYDGALEIPLRTGRITVTLHAQERGTTGTREAVMTGHLLSCGQLPIPREPIEGPRPVPGWCLDPYDAAYDGTALCSLADDERLDELFPQHPLTKVRQWLRTTVDTLTIDDEARPGTFDEAPPSGLSAADRVSQTVPPATIGLLYLTAGRAAAAEVFFLQAVPLDDEGPAAHDTDVGDALTFVGFSRELQGKQEGALSAFQRAHQVFQAAIGDGDLRTARAASNLVRSHIAQSSFEEAAALLDRAFLVLEERGTDVDVAVALNARGLVQSARGQCMDAIETYQRALRHFEKAEQVQGRPIADRSDVLTNLARAFDAVGDRRRAKDARARARAAADQMQA